MSPTSMSPKILMIHMKIMKVLKSFPMTPRIRARFDANFIFLFFFCSKFQKMSNRIQFYENVPWRCLYMSVVCYRWWCRRWRRIFQKSSNSRISSKKKPENYFKKNTKFSKPKFSQMDSSVEKLVLGKTQIRYLCQKLEFLTQKNCLNQTIWSKTTILVNKLVVNLTTGQFDHSYLGLVGRRTKNGTERSPIYRTFPIAAN